VSRRERSAPVIKRSRDSKVRVQGFTGSGVLADICVVSGCSPDLANLAALAVSFPAWWRTRTNPEGDCGPVVQ